MKNYLTNPSNTKPTRPDVVTLRHQRDDLLDGAGWPIESPEVERWWMPLLGPTATFSARYLARRLQAGGVDAAGDYRLEQFVLDDMAYAVGAKGRRTASTWSVLDRLTRFGFVWPRRGGELIEVRLWVVPPSAREVVRFPEADQPEFLAALAAWDGPAAVLVPERAR